MNIDVNGESIFVSTGGVTFDASLLCIIFLHGAAMDHTFWTLNSRYFSRNGFSVLAPDLPGHGLSGGEALSTIESLAAWLFQLLDAMGVNEVRVVGHSMGALIALESASLQPSRIKHLALLGAAFPMPVAEPLLNAAEMNQHSAIDMVSLFGTAYGSQLGHNTLAGVSVLNHCVKILERAKPGVLYRSLSACNAYANGVAAADTLTCTTTLIVGQKDQMTPPRATKNLAKLLSKVDIVELKDCGHMHPAEAPEACHQALVYSLA